jgi:hypothetical protein
MAAARGRPVFVVIGRGRVADIDSLVRSLSAERVGDVSVEDVLGRMEEVLGRVGEGGVL